MMRCVYPSAFCRGVKNPLLICLAAAGLFGCTLDPKYERPAAPVTSQYPTVTQNTEGDAADISWRTFFSEERLIKLIELALVNNRDFRVAMLNVEQSQAQYRVTRSSSFPTINASGGYTRSYSSISGLGALSSIPGLTGVSGLGGSSGSGYTSSSWSASLGTTAYEVDLFGHVRSLNRQALEKYFSTVEAQRAAQITLVSQVASQYLQLRQAEEQLKLAQQTLKTVQEVYDVNKAMFDAGQSNELDFRTSQGQIQTAKINILAYELQLEQAQDALVLLLGQPIPADLPAPQSYDDAKLLADIPAGLPSELVARRPDILEAEHTLKAANANIGAARAAFFPSITLTGSAGTTSSQFSKLFGAGTGNWTFSPGISVPIFTGGENTANLDSAKVGKRIEVANYEKAIQTAFREVADALFAIASYTDELEAQAVLIDSEQRRYDLANVRYRQGQDTYLNVLSAQQDLYSAQQNRIATKFNKLTNQISLYQALGGGWK